MRRRSPYQKDQECYVLLGQALILRSIFMHGQVGREAEGRSLGLRDCGAILGQYKLSFAFANHPCSLGLLLGHRYHRL